MAKVGVPVLLGKGDFRRILVVLRKELWISNGVGPDLIVDDGGDATLMIHKGVDIERASKILDEDYQDEGEDFRELMKKLKLEYKKNPKRWTSVAKK